MVRYEPEMEGLWEDVEIKIEREDEPDLDGPCANWQPSDDRRGVQLYPDRHSSVTIHNVCLESGKRYTVYLQFKSYDVRRETPSASILIDSVNKRPRYKSTGRESPLHRYPP